MSRVNVSRNSGIRVDEMTVVADLLNKLNEELENNVYILFSEAQQEDQKSLSRLSQAKSASLLSQSKSSDFLTPSVSLSQLAEITLLDFINYLPKRRDIDIIIFRLPFGTELDWKQDLWKHRKIRLNYLPTILRWNGPQRLTGHECNRYPLLRLLFEEECTRPWVDSSWNPRVKEATS